MRAMARYPNSMLICCRGLGKSWICGLFMVCMANLTQNATLTVLSTIFGKDLTMYNKNGSCYEVKVVDGNGKLLLTKMFVLKLMVFTMVLKLTLMVLLY